MSTPRTVTLVPAMQAIKSSWRGLVDAYGGQTPAGKRLGERQQRMSDCGLPNTRDFARIDEVALLEDETVGLPGHPHVTTALARRQGFFLVKEPEVEPEAADLLGHLGTVAKEGGDTAASILDMIKDKRIDQVEKDKVEEAIDQLIVAALRMKADVRALPTGTMS